MSFYSPYRWCIVPNCNNSTSKTPEKLFIKVPNDIYMRNVWLELSGRDPTTLSTKSILHLCEDHFYLEQDMENYMQYKIMGSVKQIRMKPNTIPSQFSHNIPIVSPSQAAESISTSVHPGSSTSYPVPGPGAGHVPHGPPSGSTYEMETSVLVKEEAHFVDKEVCVKEECEDSTDGYGVSEAAMLAGLYDEHEVKDELVLGPERPHRPTVALVTASALVSSAAVSGLGRSCSVRLERLLVDAERRTCRVGRGRGRRTYKLRTHTAEPAPTPNVTTIYQCHHCGKQFRNKSVLKKHVHTHSPLHNSTGGDYGLEHYQILHDDKKPYKYSDNKNMSNRKTKPFRCSHCGYKFNKKSRLQAHLMIHTGEKPFKCRYCDHRSGRRAHLRSHEMTHTGEKPFKCRYCDHRSSRKADLRSHEMTHTGKTPFTCHHCNKKYITKASLRNHLMIHTGEKPYKCRYCDHRSRQQAHIRNHEMTHTGEKPFKCRYCDHRSRWQADLRGHEMTHTGEKPFKCRYCDHRSRHKAHLRSHEMTHTGKTPFKCHHCDKECITKGSLRNHLMIHTGEKPYKCRHRSRRQAHLRSHEILYTSENPFKCNYCNYKCKRKADIKVHIMLHTGENPFKCNYCDYKCKRKAHLRTHEMIHTGEKHFKCNYCDYKCRRNFLLRSHEKIHTGVKTL